MSASSHHRVIVLLLCIMALFSPPDANRQEIAVVPSFYIQQEPAAGGAPPAAHPDLCAMIEAGRLDSLRWPDFTDYREQVRAFYQQAGCALAWTIDGRPTTQALSLISVLQDAARKGLHPEDYDGLLWAGRLAELFSPASQPSSADLERFDLALTVSVMRYVSDLHEGRVNPLHVRFHLNVEARELDLAEFIRTRLVTSAAVKSAIDEVEPQYHGYHRMLKALERYLALEQEGDGPPLPAPPKSVKSIKPGSGWEGVPQLAKRLRQLGDLSPDATLPAALDFYDGALAEAVERFQKRHGLAADGAIGVKTVKELNTPLSQRVLQIELTLERWRWLPHDLPSRLIVINIPEFRLRGYENQRATITMKVIVGQHFRNRQTPVFQDEMEYLIFHPYWNVPVSIARNELIPATRKNPGYLMNHHMKIVNRRGEAMADQTLDDEMAKQIRAGKLAIRQEPGAWNALGQIKFVFPNQYDVYLHGTPEKQLFARSRRDFSHGCIRIEDPPALAEWVLRDDPTWTSERIQKALESDKRLQVNLPEPIPVLVLYATVFVEEDGEVRFFEDIYKHDAALERALARGYPYPE